MQTNKDVECRVVSKGERLQYKLTEKFEWDFEDLDQEEDDEAPVVVDL